MSQVDLSPFKPDVDYVIRQGGNIRADRWTCYITAGGKTVEVLKVLNVDIQEYFESHYAAIRTIDVVMGMGQYTTILHPNRQDIVVHLIRQDAYTAGFDVSGSATGIIEDMTYIGKLITKENPALENQKISFADTASMDISAIQTAQLQLVSKVDLQLRSAQVGGIYRDVALSEVLVTAMTSAIKSIQADARELPKGIDIAPPDNTELFEQVVIPDGLPLIDLPGYLQNNYGVYSTGLSHYVRDGIWYIFPTYNVKRGPQAKYSVQISVVSVRHYPALGKTYHKTGTSAMIIANGAREIIDLSEELLNNAGNGAKFLDSNVVAGMATDTDVEPNKSFYDPALGTNDYVAFKSPTGVDNVPVMSQPITSNNFRVMSELALRSGAYFTLVWNFSDPDLVRPGTVAVIRYAEGGMVREVEGVLVQAIHSGKLYEPGFTSIDYVNQSALCFFIQRDLGLIKTMEAQT